MFAILPLRYVLLRKFTVFISVTYNECFLLFFSSQGATNICWIIVHNTKLTIVGPLLHTPRGIILGNGTMEVHEAGPKPSHTNKQSYLVSVCL